MMSPLLAWMSANWITVSYIAAPLCAVWWVAKPVTWRHLEGDNGMAMIGGYGRT